MVNITICTLLGTWLCFRCLDIAQLMASVKYWQKHWYVNKNLPKRGLLILSKTSIRKGERCIISVCTSVQNKVYTISVCRYSSLLLKDKNSFLSKNRTPKKQLPRELIIHEICCNYWAFRFEECIERKPSSCNL